MKRINYLVILSVVIIFHIQNIFGQNLNQQNYQDLWWVNLGVGAGFMESARNGVSFGASFNYYLDRTHLISGRCEGIHQISLFSLGKRKNEYVCDMGLMYGRLIKADYGYVSLSAGIGYVFGLKYTKVYTTIIEIQEEKISTYGFPFEVQLFFTPSDHVGLGFCGFANLNPDRKFFGVEFVIQYGELR